jgi:lysyl-tRNA synthetase class 1
VILFAEIGCFFCFGFYPVARTYLYDSVGDKLVFKIIVMNFQARKMAKVTWAKQEAERLLKLKKDGPLVFETGYGPSGLPHIGTFAEVARTSFVIQALKELKPDIEVQLIVFSDDMDGLRNLPENVPNHDLLRPHLGSPLSSIPDPFEEQASYSGYMNNKLQLFLDSFGFDYEFRSSSEMYKGGVFDDALKKVLDNYDKIRSLFTQTISEDKRAAWSPFFPICENCGKIYTTRVTDIDKANHEISYACDQDGALYKSCGHESKTSITGGNVKVGWKVDWALRWYTFGVNYEMYGKDLMESATMSGKICRVLGGTAPLPYKYELFLDENGAKISKKIGNGVSMDQWMNYAPFGALLNFLLGNPNKAKKMGLPILPRLVDEFLQSVRTDDVTNSATSLWFVQKNQKNQDLKPLVSDVGYSLLLNVAESIGIQDGELLYNYAVSYDEKVSEDKEFYQTLCGNVVAFVKGYQATLEKPEIEVNEAHLPLLKTIHDYVSSWEGTTVDGGVAQTYLFSIAKENEINQREWFGFLYATLLGKVAGPKIGPFLAMIGKEQALDLLGKAIEKYGVQ